MMEFWLTDPDDNRVEIIETEDYDLSKDSDRRALGSQLVGAIVMHLEERVRGAS